ncbi:ClpP/crotonase-like domain-containing protein [Pisolithus thermaeus]|nr:ClpP/crotonase-like domain-containing protein [Pisolithus croceorrhizus]KAI6165725.1 ClpP/crotonase-like domain-containing protein [Pisolithus thermaeus]
MSSSNQNLPQFPLSFPSSQPLVTLSYPHTGCWVMELHNGEDSRLTKQMIDDAIRPALDVVEEHWNRNRASPLTARNKKGSSGDGGDGALIIIGKRNQDKFFSNGFEYESVKGNPTFFTETANPLFARLLTFPIPTIAAINGHCFAAAMILALSCDYRIMTDGSRRHAWMCMNEIHFGAPWPLSFTAVLNAKVSNPSVRRRIALEGHRFTPLEALTAGLVDRLASCGGTGVELGTENVLREAMRLAKEVSALPKQGVWGSIKTFLYRECLETVRLEARTHSILPPAARL